MTDPQDPQAAILCGDALAVLPTLDEASADAIVTDPPYGLSFMGKEWDHGVPGEAFWTEALRVAKPGAYLLAFGGTRTYHRLTCAIEDAGWEVHDCLSWLYGSGFPKHKSKLKPAWEPIVMARKPAPRATLLNIDACRLAWGADAPSQHQWNRKGAGGCAGANGYAGQFSQGQKDAYARGDIRAPAGRWPANVVLDEEAASDVGEPARYFYTAKASRSEREAGLTDAPRRPGGSNAKGFTEDVARGLDRNRPVANHHPTVKPLALMRWLVRLVTPAGGLVLDPFAGSGTTGCAAVLEGRRFVGVELSEDYAAIACARIAHWMPAQASLALDATRAG